MKENQVSEIIRGLSGTLHILRNQLLPGPSYLSLGDSMPNSGEKYVYVVKLSFNFNFNFDLVES